MGALVVIVAVGIAVLAFAALRGRSSLTPAQIVASQNPNAPSAAPTVPAAPATTTSSATPEATPPNAPMSTPSPTAVPAPAKPSAGPGTATTGAPPPAGVSTLGAGPAASKLAAKTAATSAATGLTTDPNLAGRGATPVTKEPLPPPPPPAAPMVSFDEVRVLVNDGERSREREGVLQIGDGRLAVIALGSAAPIVSVPTTSLNGIFYARSRQPKWRDASGKEVESRADLGRMGFLRGERNWVILLTGGEPVILRIEDSALRSVLPALEERTGRKIQR
jgi:hypothetical protein